MDYTSPVEAIVILFWGAVIFAIVKMSNSARHGALLISWAVMLIFVVIELVKGVASLFR